MRAKQTHTREIPSGEAGYEIFQIKTLKYYPSEIRLNISHGFGTDLGF